MGNLEFAMNDIEKARENYQKGYEISHTISTTHILTARFLYKLGVLDLHTHNYSQSQYVLHCYLLS